MPLIPVAEAAAAVAPETVVYAGGGFGDGGPALRARLATGAVRNVAVDADGNVYVPDPEAHSVRLVDAATGTIIRIAGTGEAGSDGDGGPATDARLDAPGAVALAPDGTVFVAANNRVWQVGTDGVATTVAGQGWVWSFGPAGDGGPAADAFFDGL